MTQEELETLMDDSELELLTDEEDSVASVQEDALEAPTVEEEDAYLESLDITSEESELSNEIDDESILEMIDDEDILEEVSDAVMAPPADDEHRVVEQLDDVTRESEEKANEVFDKLDEIASISSQIATHGEGQVALIQDNIELFEKLSQKFTDIETFSTALEGNRKLLNQAQESMEASQKIDSIVAETMNIMQYQDIHRQKIERVVNVMRTSHTICNRFLTQVWMTKREVRAL